MANSNSGKESLSFDNSGTSLFGKKKAPVKAAPVAQKKVAPKPAAKAPAPVAKKIPTPADKPSRPVPKSGPGRDPVGPLDKPLKDPSGPSKRYSNTLEEMEPLGPEKRFSNKPTQKSMPSVTGRKPTGATAPTQLTDSIYPSSIDLAKSFGTMVGSKERRPAMPGKAIADQYKNKP